MVDSTIQSLIQSPYVRTLASIPAKSEKLVHGISDNVPPFSRRRVYLQPSQGQNTLHGPFRFNIPRMGLLDQMSLRIRVKHGQGANWIAAPPATVIGSSTDTVSYFSNCLDAVELYSKQRFLERLEGSAIFWEDVQRMNGSEIAYTGSYADQNSAGDTVSPTVALPDDVVNHSKTQMLSAGYDVANTSTHGVFFPEFVVPLPFACFSAIKKNFQTYFVENLTLEVLLKNDPYYHSIANLNNRFYLELVCDFHQYHPNVETVIRNANYKQGVPATLPWYDWVKFDQILVSNSSVKTYSLESDALISEMLITPLQTNGAKIKVLQDYYVVITANSDVLYESSYADAITQLGRDRVMDASASAVTSLSSRTDSHYKVFFPIVFGLYRSSDHFSGGISLASLVNPRISIYPNRSVYAGGTTNVQSCQFDNGLVGFEIVAKRHYLLRIDSDTGVVTRTIES